MTPQRSMFALTIGGSLLLGGSQRPAQQPTCPLEPTRSVQAEAGRVPERQRAEVAAMTRLIEAAYPGRRVVIDDSVYVVERNATYRVNVHFERDTASGFAALAYAYDARNAAALRTGRAANATGCRAPMELVIARMPRSGAPTIVARQQLDSVSVAIDIRTMDLDIDEGTPIVNFMYHAYYGSPEWFGFVTWNSAMWLENGQISAQRIPRGYLKLRKPAMTRMEGYLNIEGADRARGTVKILAAAFGPTSTDVEDQHVEVALRNGRWIDGAELLAVLR